MAKSKSAPAAKPVAAKPAPVAKPVPVAKKAEPVVVKPVQSAKKAQTTVDVEVRRRMIAEAAYYIAEKRGFIHGHHDVDWAEAERQIDALLAK